MLSTLWNPNNSSWNPMGGLPMPRYPWEPKPDGFKVSKYYPKFQSFKPECCRDKMTEEEKYEIVPLQKFYIRFKDPKKKNQKELNDSKIQDLQKKEKKLKEDIIDQTNTHNAKIKAMQYGLDATLTKTQQQKQNIQQLRQDIQQTTQKTKKVEHELEEIHKRHQEKMQEDIFLLREYPRALFQKTKEFECGVNVCIIGRGRSGKSEILNTIRNIDSTIGNDDVQIRTQQPTPYKHDLLNITFWDLPGYGNKEHPFDTYLSEMGLRYFDLAIVMTSDGKRSGETKIVEELTKHKKKFILVRGNFDILLESKMKQVMGQKKRAHELMSEIKTMKKNNDSLDEYHTKIQKLYEEIATSIRCDYKDFGEIYLVDNTSQDTFDMLDLKSIMKEKIIECVKINSQNIEGLAKQKFANEDLEQLKDGRLSIFYDNITPLTPPAWFANLDQEDKDKMVALLSQALNQYESFGSVKQDLIEKFQIKDFQAEELYKFVYYSQL